MNSLVVCLVMAIGLASANPLTGMDVPASNSKWSYWGAWSSCPVTCGTGQQIRQRECVSSMGGNAGGSDLTLLLLMSGALGDSLSSDSLLQILALSGGQGGIDLTTLLLSGALSGNNSDISSLITLLALQNSGSSSGGFNPLLISLLSGNNGNSSDLSSLLLLMSLMGSTGGNSQCTGSKYEYQDCNRGACPTTGNCLGQWSQWGSCSATCGYATKTRTRTCTCTDMYGQIICQPQSTETTSCSYGVCSVVMPTITTPTQKYTEWTEWSTCMRDSNKCTQMRTRSCLLANKMECTESHSHRRPCSGCDAVVTQPSTAQRQCALDLVQRIDCGYPGITQMECISKGCCFDNTVSGTPWCYYQANAQGMTGSNVYPKSGITGEDKEKVADEKETENTENKEE